MTMRNAVIVSTALLLAGPVWAQTRPAPARPAGDAPMKVAVISIQAAIASTAEGKEAATQLQAQFTPQRDALDGLSKQIQDLQTRLQNGQRTLSDQEKDRLAAQGQRLTAEFQRKQQELNEDASDARNEAVNTIGQKMVQVIDKYARQNAYSIVLDTSAQSSPVLFASDAIDITNDIVKLYDQSYPAKRSSTTPPAGAKPKQK
ncbi:MAG TPA: OmpH family outer membrane protein [Candidatus Acidoferrales bacterium]|nr:OmpH family outer membrane protein [Candidatus Acidoferrales bacterium]